jgi:beta-phosphoglucomutase
MRKWPAAVLFDFDGVIVNSEPLHFQAFAEVLASEQIDLTEDEYYRDMIGFDDKGAFKYIFDKRGKTLDAKTSLRVMTRKSAVMMDLIHRRQFTALPGVEEFVRGLWRNYPLAVCSGALREEIEAMLEGVSLRDCFPTIVAAEDVTVGKPDPQGYLLAMQQVSTRLKKGIAPGDCLIVEDAPTVIAGVRSAGFTVLGVATTYPTEKLTEANWAVKSLHPEHVQKVLPGLQMGIGI